jgi:hypothetical protein
MKLDGQCHCGAIAWEAEIDPEAVRLCHCTDCQALSGSAFRVTARTSAFRLLRGTLTTYVKTAESGRRRVQAFCGTCGAPIHASGEGEAEPKMYSLRLGTCRQRAQLAPKGQIWAGSTLPWVEAIAQVPKRPKG